MRLPVAATHARSLNGAPRASTSFTVSVRHQSQPWVVIVEPDAEARVLVVVTTYEVSE